MTTPAGIQSWIRATHARSARILLLILLLLTLHAGSAYSQAVSILYLNSYHAGYKWSDEEHQGFLDTLKENQTRELSLHVEYLDMKRYFSEQRYDQLAEILSIKYDAIPIDLVVVADDAAFEFMKRFGPNLFPDVPVFFCGVNYLVEADLEGLHNFRGVTEKADITSTFAAIFRMLPETQHVYIINDTTISGQKVHPAIEKAVTSFSDKASFTFLEDLSMSDIIKRVDSVSDRSVIFYTFFLRDALGQGFEYDQSMKLIYRQSPVPIFGAWDFNLGLGLTGGMLTSGYQQGKALAELTLNWLNAADIEQLPKVTDSPNRFFFDHTQLARFGIKASLIPPDSTIINKPVSFFAKHRQVLILSGLSIAALLVVITVLTFNILRRKKAERELRISEKQFRSIFNNASDGLYQSSADGHFQRVNPALAAMLKFDSANDLIAASNESTSTFHTVPKERQRLLATLKQNDWVRGEHLLECQDGSSIDVIETIHPIRDEHGALLYYEGSITNITEYKQTQELIAQTEKVVSLGGVAAGIAHEIRSPLASIIQGIQVIQARLLEDNESNLSAALQCGCPLDSVKRYAKERDISTLLGHIREAGQRAGVIIEDMLSFSRKTIGDFAMEPLEKILEQAVDLASKDHELRKRCDFKHVTIHREYEENLPKIYCSASKILQVFFNILKNGAEAMGEAGTANPQFTLRLMRTGEMARVEIEDNGPGMSNELAQKIFDPFFTTKGREKGTGLGLSVSYFIIRENHRGDLRVSSQPDLGATFIIELPLKAPVEGVLPHETKVGNGNSNR